MSIYLGTFFITLATMALEVSLSRLLNYCSWYYIAFFAVSTAMLGMTAGAVEVYLHPQKYTPEKLRAQLAFACWQFSLWVPAALILICLLPISGHNQSVMSVFLFLVLTASCSLPFYFSGLAVSAVLTRAALPIGKLYAADLAGAALGCLFVLGGLELFNASSFILLCGSVGIPAAYAFGWGQPAVLWKRVGLWVLALLLLGSFFNSRTPYGIRPLVVKSYFFQPADYEREEWNSFSHVSMGVLTKGKPQYWGASPKAPQNPDFEQRTLIIDGAAGTTLRKFGSRQDIEHLRYDVTNLVYHLCPPGNVCVIGVGGGKDVMAAVWFGHPRVTGIDINPIFIRWLQRDFKTFAGIGGYPGVTLVADEARNYLSHTRQKFSVIQMSLIDTWAATGAFSLSENSLYTIEAWNLCLNRLTEDGTFTVSRWYNPKDLGETGRAVSLAMASLFHSGVRDPRSHLAMATCGYVSTLLVSKKPWDPPALERLKKTAAEFQYALVISPDALPANPTLRKIVSAKSLPDLRAAIADAPYNFTPPSDQNPYFFNMLRLNHLSAAFHGYQEGVIIGNLKATLVLIALIASLGVLCLATIVVPLLFGPKIKTPAAGSGLFWSGALYFSLIGAGFMCVEIALMQRLSTFLSRPLHALGIVLFTIIASTGLGSFLSEFLQKKKYLPWLFPFLTSAAIILVHLALNRVLAQMITSALSLKIFASIVVIFPLGLFLGWFFPSGMKIFKAAAPEQTAWYWALNGIFGVLFSALAVFISIYFSIAVNFYLAAVFYLLIPFCLFLARREAGKNFSVS